jgi:purine-nucleoside phosphorylase
MLDKINEAKNFINKLTSNKDIHTVIILGSGMSGFEKNYEIIHQVSYSEIPNFLQPSIEGHSGTLSVVEIEGRYTAILSGRAHYYEGYPIQELVIPVRTFSSLGAINLILTNAAGGISSNYNPGDIVSITDHINLTGDNPLIGKNLDDFGPRFPDMSEVYSKQFLQIAESICKKSF